MYICMDGRVSVEALNLLGTVGCEAMPSHHNLGEIYACTHPPASRRRSAASTMAPRFRIKKSTAVFACVRICGYVYM